MNAKKLSIEQINAEILKSASVSLESASTLPADAYTSEEYFDYEMETIFKQEWICVAHQSQVPKPGDYISLDVVGEPIIVVRGKDNGFSILSRVCPHRAMDIMPEGFGYEDKGKVRLFMCPYHSWTFDLDGQLKGAPEMQRTCEFNRKDFCLTKYRTEVWEGYIFMTFNEDAAPVATQLSDLYKDVKDWKMGEMDIVIEMEWDLDVNWKNMIENWMEPYHHMGIHVKTLQPMMPAKSCWTEPFHPHYTRAHLPYRENLTQSIKDAEAKGEPYGTFPPIPGIPEEGKYEWVVHTGFPGYMMLTGPNCVLWYRILPISAEKISLVTTVMVTKEAQAHPDFEKHLAEERQGLEDFHLEDVQVCTAVQRGFNSQAFQKGRMSYLEEPVHQIQRYLASRIRETGNAPAEVPTLEEVA